MSRPVTGFAVLGAIAAFAAPRIEACDRDGLQAVAEKYIAAQTRGDPSLLPHLAATRYVERGEPTALGRGILAKPLKIDFHRSLLDTKTCQTFTEAIVTDASHPYVLGTRLRVDKGKAIEVETLVTDKHDWLFSARNDLKYSPNEDWGVIAPEARDGRDTLIAAANAYFDLFMDKSVKVPWGTPCNRLEGGLRTACQTRLSSRRPPVPRPEAQSPLRG